MQVDDGACKRIYFYQNDPNGAPVRLSRADGDIVWETHYSVSGGVDWCETRKVEQAIRLQGQYFDDESGLHYNRHRYFDLGVGIFISRDPIGLKGGLNPYEFAPNMFGWIDPLGLKKKCPHRKPKKRETKSTGRTQSRNRNEKFVISHVMPHPEKGIETLKRKILATVVSRERDGRNTNGK